MKIVFTSDIHYDISPWNREFTVHLADAVERLSPDVFVIAGDISTELTALGEALSLFAALPCDKMMVPGNHDLWVSRSATRKGRDSWYKYTAAIPEICRKHGFSYLATDPIWLGCLQAFDLICLSLLIQGLARASFNAEAALGAKRFLHCGIRG